jgi:hypothetical protein
MNPTIESKKNKALVLGALDTLFNQRDYVSAERYRFRTTFSTALISRRVARACSVSSRVFCQP